MSDASEMLRSALAGGSALALPLSLIGGVVTGFNPCCFPLYPAAAATCCAARGERLRVAVSTAAAFVLGIAVMTSLLGVLAALAGRVIADLGAIPRYAIALIPLAMAIHVLGWIRLPIPQRLRTERRSIGGAFFAGLLLSIVLAPCGTPLLASVLAYAAYEGSAAYGGLLLFLYGLGMGVPVLIVGLTSGSLAMKLDRSGWQSWVDRLAGASLLALGFFLLWKA